MGVGGKAWFRSQAESAPTAAVSVAKGEEDASADEDPAPLRPFAAALPRPSWEELMAAAGDDRLRLLVRWLPDATAAELAQIAALWLEDSFRSDEFSILGLVVPRWRGGAYRPKKPRGAPLTTKALFSRRYLSGILP